MHTECHITISTCDSTRMTVAIQIIMKKILMFTLLVWAHGSQKNKVPYDQDINIYKNDVYISKYI